MSDAQHVPAHLRRIVDEAAGREHSAEGSVMRCLAEVLEVHRRDILGMRTDGKFEAVGPFELHPPIGGGSGWTMKRDDEWVPVTLDSRDACIFLAGMLAHLLHRATVEQLRDQYNREQGVNVTLEHLLAVMFLD
jgi:hypothetical protein